MKLPGHAVLDFGIGQFGYLLSCPKKVTFDGHKKNAADKVRRISGCALF